MAIQTIDIKDVSWGDVMPYMSVPTAIMNKGVYTYQEKVKYAESDGNDTIFYHIVKLSIYQIVTFFIYANSDVSIGRESSGLVMLNSRIGKVLSRISNMNSLNPIKLYCKNDNAGNADIYVKLEGPYNQLHVFPFSNSKSHQNAFMIEQVDVDESTLSILQ